MKRILLIVGVVVVILLYVVWRGQTEQVLKRHSKNLISLADQVGGGIGLFDVNRLEGLLAEEVTFEIEIVADEPFSAGRIEVLSAYRWLGSNVQKSDFKIAEFTNVQIDGDRATLELQVEGMLEMPDMRMLEGDHSVVLDWHKDERGDWQLERFVWN